MDKNIHVETELKERTISVRLSDRDCDKLMDLCGICGLSVGELIEGFVGDLVNGTHTHGSDERMYAERWFERCGFEMFAEPTLLQHLLYWGYEPEDYINAIENIKDADRIKKDAYEKPELYDEEELSFVDDDIADWEEELRDMREDWIPEKKPNMDAEIKLIKDWIRDKNSLKIDVKESAFDNMTNLIKLRDAFDCLYDIQEALCGSVLTTTEGVYKGVKKLDWCIYERCCDGI